MINRNDMELWNDRLDKFYITGRQFRIEKRETALYHGAAKKQLETVNGKSSSSRKFVTCDCSAAIPKIVTLQSTSGGDDPSIWRGRGQTVGKRRGNESPENYRPDLQRQPRKWNHIESPHQDGHPSCTVVFRAQPIHRRREEKPIFIPRTNHPWKLTRFFLKWKLPGYGCWSWFFFFFESNENRDAVRFTIELKSIVNFRSWEFFHDEISKR